MLRSFLAKHKLKEYEFSADLFPTVEERAFWDAFPNRSCIADAEAAIDYAWPIIKATDFMEFKKSGNRVVMEQPHFERRHHLSLFVLAELTENKGRFVPQIVNGIFAICEESFWGLSAHMPHHTYTLEDIPMPNEPYIDLFAAETAALLAIACKTLEPALKDFCPRILERVEEELNRRIRSPYIVHRDFVWMGYHKKNVNNWNPWIISNLITVFLLTESSRARLDRAMEKMLVELQVYYDCIPADGGCDEGPSYYGHSGIAMFECLYQLKQASGGAIDFFTDDKICALSAYPKKARMVSDIFVNVADAHVQGLCKAFMPETYLFAKMTNRSDVMNMAAALVQEQGDYAAFVTHTNALRRTIYRASVCNEISEYPVSLPLNDVLEVLPALQIAVLRRGDLTLSLKGGNNHEGHNHNDVGSFSLYDGNLPIFADIGINTYTRMTFDKTTRYTLIPWTRSAYHNLPLINNVEQCYGAEYKTDSFEATEEELMVSYPAAYPVEAGIEKLTRHLALEENGLRITDRFEFAKGCNKNVKEMLMCVRPVRVENNTAIVDEKFRISTSVGKITCECVPFDDERLTADWSTDSCTRIAIECDGAEEFCIKVERI